MARTLFVNVSFPLKSQKLLHGLLIFMDLKQSVSKNSTAIKETMQTLFVQT